MESPLTTIRAFAFDVAGTLYDCPTFDALVEDQAFVALARTRGCSIDAARKALRAQRAENATLHGDTSKVRALEALGVPRRVFQDAAAALEPSEIMSDEQPVGPLFASLQAMGAKVGVLSNFKRALVTKLFTTLDIQWAQVDALVCVDDELPIKPSPIPFVELCRRLGVQPRDTAFVGDSLSKDLTPAKRLGMTTVLVESGQADGDLAFADFRVSSVHRLLDLLASR